MPDFRSVKASVVETERIMMISPDLELIRTFSAVLRL